MVSKKDGMALLASVPMFETLSQRTLGKVWDSMKIVDHSAGHVIMQEGRSGLGFHLILDGQVKVERKGKQVTLGRGAFFGEMSLIDGGPRTATVTAATEVVSAVLNGSVFKSFVAKQPDVMWKMLVHTTERLRAEQATPG